MCGIAGFVPFQQSETSILSNMANLIHHRGPDDEGFVFFDDKGHPHIYGGNATPAHVYEAKLPYTPQTKLDSFLNINFQLALAHRRLSILDLSATGHQPMASSDGRYWLTYNGEIYNYIELRTELENLGHSFNSHSDTEVILAAFKQWGKKSFNRFNGMFAFLIFDRESNTLIAVRDRFGIKPLYYRVSTAGIAFASEIKQFTALHDWAPQLNGQRVYDFLNWAITDHTDETLFAGVYQLRGGQYLELSLKKITAFPSGIKLPATTWYSLQPGSHYKGSFQNACEDLLKKMRASVSLHLRADVPIGSCLSGGLDSSSLVCLMNEELKRSASHSLQKTFSACVDVPKLDERTYIKEVVTQTGVQDLYVTPEVKDLFASCDEIVWHQDEPFGSTSIFAQWHVFKLAANNQVRVMLDGQGADEQFAGYHNFFGPYFAGLFKTGRWFKLVQEITATKKLHGYSVGTSFKWMSNMLLPEFLRQKMRSLAGKAHTTPTWLNIQKLGAIPKDPFTEIGHKSASLRDFSITQLTSSNLQMLLHWEDRDSMAHSIESRVPYLEHNLVEYVIGLPDNYKLSEGVTKRVLRSAMHGILPDKITHRMDKLGFVTPEEIWLREKAPEQFREALNSAIQNSNGILNDSIKTIFESMVEGRIPFSFLIWRAISFGSWMKQFNIEVKND